MVSLAVASLTGCFAFTAPNTSARAGLAASAPHAEVMLFGRLTQRRTTGIAGATVAVYEILPDSRLLPVVDHVVQTETDGTYRLRIRLDGAYRGPLLVRADCEFGYGMVLVSDTQVVNDGIAVLPITDATTVQAQVYLTARQQRLWPENLDVVHIHRFISEPFATAVLMESDHTQVTETLARAVTAAAIGFEQTLRAAPRGLSAAAWHQARTAIHGAYFTLADDLYHATDADAVSAARRAFDDRLAAAQAKNSGDAANAPEPAWTIASQAAWEAFLPYVAALPPAARAAAVLQMEQERARMVVNLMAGTFTVAGQDAAVSRGIEQAGATLLATLAGLRGDPDGIVNAARDAWAAYQNVIGPMLPQLTEPAQQEALSRALSALDRQAVAATAQLRRLDAAADPAVTAAEARRQVCAVFDAARPADAAQSVVREAAIVALGNVSLARLR